MTDRLSRAALLLVVLLCASFCLTEQAEVDLHWHLATGESILRGAGVPRVDDLTYTSAGRPWIDLHWLFQVALAAAYRSAGWIGIDLLKIGCVAGAFLLALRTARRRGVSFSILAPLALVAVLASQERFAPRPEVVSFLLLAALLAILEERRRHPRLLLILPVLLAIWANAHALYVVGLAVLVLTAAGDYIESRRAAAQAPAGLDSAAAVRLAGIAFVSLAATAATPFGLRGWTLPWRLLFERIASDNVYSRHIAEFQAPFGGYGPTTSIAAFALLSAVAIAAVAIGRRVVRPAEALSLGALFVLALLARRNIPLFALASLPLAGPPIQAAMADLARRLPGWGGEPGARIHRLSSAGAALVVLASLFLLADTWSNRFYERDGTQRYFGTGAAPGFYPEGAADFVLARKPAGEVIHDMTMGGFLAWRWRPARRTFIDGRLEVHDESLFRAYLGLQNDPALFEETARRLGARTVLWSHRHSPEAAGLLRYLADSPDWRLVYVDLAACVFMREPEGTPADVPEAIDPADSGLGERILQEIRQAEAARTDPAPAFLRRLLPRRPVPVAAVNAGLFFGITGAERTAETLFRAALAQAPGNAVIHYDLGLALSRAGRGGEATVELEAALRLDPGLSAAREGLALQLLEKGDEEGALRQWAVAEDDGPLAPASLRARGALLARKGKIDEAIQDYRKAIDVAPRDLRLRSDLALLYHRRGMGQQAAAEIRRALLLDNRACAPRVVLGRINTDEGRPRDAETIYREAIRMAGGQCPEAEKALEELLWSGAPK